MPERVCKQKYQINNQLRAGPGSIPGPFLCIAAAIAAKAILASITASYPQCICRPSGMEGLAYNSNDAA